MKKTCYDILNCCDCGNTSGDGCGCRYCFSCNACPCCLNENEEECDRGDD